MQGSADIARVVYHHQWNSLLEWGVALERLSELNDGDIDELVRDEDVRNNRQPS